MKFICERNVLLKEIGIAKEIITSNNVISILSNIYIEAVDDYLILRATDVKVNFETKVPVNVIEPGVITVFCEKFVKALDSSPDGEMVFEQVDANLVIQTAVKKINYRLKSIASDNFPQFPEPDEASFFSIPIKEFKDMLGQTVFAVSSDETRYFMTGVLFERKEEKFNMVSTDGRRLAFIGKEVPAEVPAFAPIIVPPKILNVIMKRAGDEGEISISVGERIIFVRFGDYKLSSILIEGQFPNYERVIPKNQEFNFVVNRAEMLESVHRVSGFAEKGKRILMGLSNGTLKISTADDDYGSVEEEIPFQYEGDDVSIAMNYRYIEEPLKAIDTEEVRFRFTDTSKAVTVVPEPETDFVHVVMPMQQP